MNPELDRLQQAQLESQPWYLWGTYVSERQWGTVREDYSANGDAWNYLPHDHARSRAYRWGEDGLAGISDDKQRICMALALWNGQDPILKERLFGLTGPEGNHGEDVKEYYYYLDSTPTHSYMKMLYKYPQAAFPYEWLIEESARRDRAQPEFELSDTGIFNENRYFDIEVEYAKATSDDLLLLVSVTNRGPAAASLHLLPTVWFRNVWSWCPVDSKPSLHALNSTTVQLDHTELGQYHWYCQGAGDLLFTENDTNVNRLYGTANPNPYVKDAFHNYIIKGSKAAVNPAQTGTKAAAHYFLQDIAAGATVQIKVRLQGPGIVALKPSATASPQTADSTGEVSSSPQPVPAQSTGPTPDPWADFDQIMTSRQQEADQFYAALQPISLNDDERRIHRAALAGLLWSKQFYGYDVRQWLSGDPNQPPPPPERLAGRNWDWGHLYNERVMSMPDKWEYPWYAAWDLAFHCITLALVDTNFAKSQLDLLMREWYQHPNGQVPAYEWNFGDVNPPVQAWAAWRVYEMERKQTGTGDRAFLESVFHKLMLNFTWWVNRKDRQGKNIFQGGFLGLDNIGVFDRSSPPLPSGGSIEESDATGWMGMFSLNMLKIALELAATNPVYENIASKFFEHFLSIAEAMNNLSGKGTGLWNDEDQFFYDIVNLPDGNAFQLKVRSLVGLIPLLAVETLDQAQLETLPGFRARLIWYLNNRPDLADLVSHVQVKGMEERRLLALVRVQRMTSLLKRMLDASEFLSDYGIRSLSKYHLEHPYQLNVEGGEHMVDYEPAESRTNLFGGNSNWRGPIWFPINYLLIESLQKFHHYYGDDFKIECPTGSGQQLTLDQIADELSHRLIKIFRASTDGKDQRPFNGGNPLLQNDPNFRDHLLFYEYFHGDNGAGLGASHQTGWTGLVAKLLQQQGEKLDNQNITPLETKPAETATQTSQAAVEGQAKA